MSGATDRRPILFVMHSNLASPGQVEIALEARGWATEARCPRNGEALPRAVEQYAAVVVFGGAMSSNDEHLDFIRAELDWIPRVLAAGLPLLGICLGAQLLARCLGASVAAHPDGLQQTGYYPIVPTSPTDGPFGESLSVYHWHAEGFEVPSGARLLLTGDIFAHQAFRYGTSAYGLQFHPEIQEPIIRHWSKEWHDVARPGGYDPAEQLRQHARFGERMHRWLGRLIDCWLVG